MARNYAALPHEYLEEMEMLSDAEFGRLCRALLKYSMTGEEERLQGAEKVLLKRVFLQERRYQDSYDDITKARKEAGKKGANKRWHGIASDSKAIASHSKNGNTETDTNTNILLSEDRKNNAPVGAESFPSESDVAAYFETIGRNALAANIWYRFYKAIGWHTADGESITAQNWKEIVRKYGGDIAPAREEFDDGP